MSPPRTVSGAETVIRAVAPPAVDSLRRWPNSPHRASAAIAVNSPINARRVHSPRVRPRSGWTFANNSAIARCTSPRAPDFLPARGRLQPRLVAGDRDAALHQLDHVPVGVGDEGAPHAVAA